LIEERYTTQRGHKRRRLVAVDLDAVRSQLRDPTVIDRGDWTRFREAVTAIVGESAFEIWFAPVTLGGVDRSGALVAVAPTATRSWLVGRFGGAIAQASGRTGRPILVADEAQTQAIHAAERAQAARPPCGALTADTPESSAHRGPGRLPAPHKEVG
jgi:hypothetical protein